MNERDCYRGDGWGVPGEQSPEQERAEWNADWTRVNTDRIPPRYREAAIDAEEVGTGLYLFGAVGSGKTYKAAGIMRAWIAAGARTRWVTVPTWLHDQRDSFASDETLETIASITAGRLLVVDDIGVERATDWALETLYVLIAEAYNNETPIVVTGNLTLAKLADRLGPRIVDRLVEVCRPVEMSGRSRRLPPRSAS